MPKIPILTRRRQRIQNEADHKAFLKAAGAIAGTLNAGMIGGQGFRPGSSWFNAGNMQVLHSTATQQLQSQFKQPTEAVETALQEQGLSWSPPFGPGRPLNPYLGYRTPARVRDYQVGTNVQITPRHGRISFETLRGIMGSYDIAQLCVQHRVDDVRSLDISWLPAAGVKTDVTADVDQAKEFFRMPDRRRPFSAWLAMWLYDIMRWDAGALYIRRNNLEEPIALEVVDGTTLIPLTDFYGRVPLDEDDDDIDPDDLEIDGDVVPAFVQIIQGLPWVWLTADDLIYQPLNPVPESLYGLAPLEKILLTANTDIRFQWHFLNYFTEGSLPAGFMDAPPDMSDPAQIQMWQEIWDDIMIGDQTKLRQIRWVPNGSKFTSAKNEDFNPEFPLYLLRRTCAAYGVTPNDMGFTEDVNRASADTQVDVQFRVGTQPLLRHIEEVLTLFAQRELGLRVQLQIDDGREVEDRVATAQAHSIYIQAGVESPDEVRDELGMMTDKTQAVSRFIQTRQGVVPLEALLSQTKNPIDPETYAPAGPVPYQSLLPSPIGKPPEPGETQGEAAVESGVGEQSGVPAGQRPALAGGADASNTNTTPSAAIAKGLSVGDEVSHEGVSGTVTAVWRDQVGGLRVNVQRDDGLGEYGLPIGQISQGASARTARIAAWKAATAGVTAATGITGIDLTGHDHDHDHDEDEDDEAELAKQAIDLWRASSRNRVRKGRAVRRFVDPNLPADVHDRIWGALEGACTRREVDAAFDAALGKARARKAGYSTAADFHRHADPIVEHYQPLIADQLRALVPAGKVEQVAGKHKPAVAKAVTESPPAGGDEDDLVGVLRDALAAVATEKAVTKLGGLLRELYGDSALQGAHSAATAASAPLPDWVASLDLPDDYWDRWQPGWGEAASKVAGDGLKDLLDEQDVTIKGMSDTSLERLANTLADGLKAGDSISATARNAVDAVGDRSRASTIVNTEYARAMSSTSVDTFRQLGVEQVNWLAEDDACPECDANASGSPYQLDDAPTVPEHPDCFPAGVVVSGVAVRGSTTRWWEGELVEIVTRDGRLLPVTPNHPILTEQGWVAAASLSKGDQIVGCLDGQRVAVKVDPDDHHGPALIEDVAISLGCAAAVSAVVVPLASKDFHGDGIEGEVCVVRTDGLLGCRVNSPLTEPLSQQEFGGRDSERTSLASGGDLGPVFEGLLTAANCGVGSGDVGLSLSRGAVGLLKPIRCGIRAPNDAVVAEDMVDRAATDSMLFGELVARLPGEVALDEIVSVRRHPFSGHVYNLETGVGWYIANGIVVHNCRCAIQPADE